MEEIKSNLTEYTFPKLMEYSTKKFAKRPCLGLVGQKALTYKEVCNKSKFVSKLLRFYGLKEGDKVALYSNGRPQFGISYFGIVNTKMISVPLLPDFSASEVEIFLDHCGVQALIVEERLYAKLKKIEEKLPSLIINIEDFSIIKGKEYTAEEVEKVELPALKIEENDTASIIYTSGTTGRSKGVELSHKNLVWSAVSGQCVHVVKPKDVCLSFLPISHVYEFSVGFTMQYYFGSSVYYLGKPPVVSALLPAFKKIKPTIVLSVPLIIEKIYKSKILPTLNSEKIKKLYSKKFFKKIINKKIGKTLIKTFGGRLNFFGVGGSKMDSEIEQFLKDIKFPYAIGYGLTETSPLLAGSGPEITVPGCLGPCVTGVDVKIINKNEEGIGEIVAKGPNVMKGYYKDEELTKAVFTTQKDECGPGYFKTGDLGVLDADNKLYMKGRLKNMILGSSGENIYPEDIEFVLNQHPFINESLVLQDEGKLVALVTLEDIAKNIGNAIKDILDFINKKVNRSSRITKVEVVPEFEHTASKKIRRYLYPKKNTQAKNDESKKAESEVKKESGENKKD